MLWMILTSSTKPLFAFIVRRKRPLPFAPWITNPIGYSGSIFLIKPAGAPVVTMGSVPWRDPLDNAGAEPACPWADEKPAKAAMRVMVAILSHWRVDMMK